MYHVFTVLIILSGIFAMILMVTLFAWLSDYLMRFGWWLKIRPSLKKISDIIVTLFLIISIIFLFIMLYGVIYYNLVI